MASAALSENEERLLAHLAFIYFAMAYGADGDLHEAELEAVTEKLHARYPDLERAFVEKAASRALTAYMDTERAMAQAIASVAVLKDRLPSPARRLIYEDLLRVAEADGAVVEPERKLLTTLAEEWDLDVDPLL